MNGYNPKWVIAVSEPLVPVFLKKHLMDSSIPLEVPPIVGLRRLVALVVRGNQDGEASKLTQELFSSADVPPKDKTVGLFEVG